MKFQNIIYRYRAIVFIVLAFCFGFFIWYMCSYQGWTETYQPKKREGVLQQLDKFCNENLGDEWGIDNIFQYNNKVIFVVVQTKDAIIDLSILPENRAIVVENIRGTIVLKKRVYRF